MKIAENHLKVLKALNSVHEDYGGDFSFSHFKRLHKLTELPIRDVRRSARFLARRGLAQFGSGLWTEDGDMYGSGYAITKEGVARLADIQQESKVSA